MANPERAILFIDGNNWYHGLKRASVGPQGGLNFARVAKKVVGPRNWIASRYYIGQVSQSGNLKLYADQRSFIDSFRAQDERHSVYYGRLERRPVKSEFADELLQYLANLTVRIDPGIYRELVSIGKRCKESGVMVEKAVDVMLAVDLVKIALQDGYDAAYILSADGDYTHAVDVVRGMGKKVFALSASRGAQLARSVNSFINIDSSWLQGCWD